MASNKFKIAFGLACLLLVFTVSNDSLWIDEANTWLYARLGGVAEVLHRLSTDHQADCQMPLSMVMAFVFEKILGDGEWQLRAPNLIWGALSLLAIYQAGKKLELPWLVLFFAVQPYWWFYMDEARPYALQILGGCWLFYATVNLVRSEASFEAHGHLAGACTLLCYSTMLAPATLVALAIGLGLVPKVWDKLFQKEFSPIWAIAIVLNIPVGLHYLATLHRGAEGTKIWAVDFKIPPYWLYEISGVFGLGPGTSELRALGRGSMSGVLDHVWVPLGFLLIYGLVWMAGCFFLKDRGQRSIFWVSSIVVGLTAFSFLTAAFLFEKAFWARHFAPLFAFVVCLLYLPLAALGRKGGIGQIAVLLIWMGLTISAFQVRFSVDHEHDNYREAARIAKEESAKGKFVYWVANRESGDYYKVPFEPEVTSKIYDLSVEASVDRTIPVRDLCIVYTKPDIFDPAQEVGRYLKEKNFQVKSQLRSFEVYEAVSAGR